MKVHFIAIGGAAMHNLAIALHLKDYLVTGSDDEIFEPSKSRLEKYGILPEKSGWFAANISSDIDAVIIGMHAKKDNIELIKAQELGLKIYSFPEYLYEQSKNKTRVVIGGSHGKTTITAMILHVLKQCGVRADYMVGAQLDGFDVMVKLTEKNKIMVLEGDEYLTSPLDPRPKFHVYQPDIALISGIAWDHVNVFKTFEDYSEQFKIFIDKIEVGGSLIYCKDDPEVNNIVKKSKKEINKIPYQLPLYDIEDGITYVKTEVGKIPLQIFGKHNLSNMNGARLVCKELGVTDAEFYEAIQSFSGASKRLEEIGNDGDTHIYKDFAHSPSKLRATVEALKNQFPEKKLVACMELHTYSSLNPEFINEYKGTMDLADLGIIYFNPNVSKHKNLPELKRREVRQAFDNNNLKVFKISDSFVSYLLNLRWTNKNLLLMSSGNFDGVSFEALAKNILQHK